MDRLLSFRVSPATFSATALFIIVALLLLRLVYVIRSIQHGRCRNSIIAAAASTNLAKRTAAVTTSSITSTAKSPPSNHKVKIMIVLGSGGHTTEMMRLLQELDARRYAPVIFVVADSDTTSIPRLQKYIREDEDHGRRRWEGRNPAESSSASDTQCKYAVVHRLPRAREVHQSYLSSVFTTLQSFLRTLILLWKVRPELVLANGPGTCVPVIYSAFLLRVLMGGSPSRCCKVIFVESLCRVKTLSLSGRLVYPIVDQFVVHWPCLTRNYPMVEVCDVFVPHDKQEGGDGDTK